MNRRSFLTALAAPLIVRPSLEDIERLTWRRRFFPGYSPPVMDPGEALRLLAIKKALEDLNQLFVRINYASYAAMRAQLSLGLELQRPENQVIIKP